MKASSFAITCAVTIFQLLISRQMTVGILNIPVENPAIPCMCPNASLAGECTNCITVHD